VAAELVAANAATPWESLMLAVDFKGATVVPHQVEATA
jgi:homoserine kinase